MSKSKYISVIHVPTDKIVTAFKFENDATWIGREKDELIATANYCKPGEKVKMIFVKSYTKTDGKFVYSYFRSAPNQSKLNSNMPGESNEHKIAKQNIYDGIYSNKIKINGEVIDKNKGDDIYIEYRTSSSGYVIPDIMIKFKEEDIKYGLGIFIEVQLSNQGEDETLLRTYSRVVEGFSGIWLWVEDFDDDWNLIIKNLIIKSHKKLISELDEKIENNFIGRINKYGKIIDKKFEDYKIDLSNYSEGLIGSFENTIAYISKNEINKLEVENEKLKELRELAKKLDLNSWKRSSTEFKEFTKKMLNNGKIEVENFVSNLIEDKINRVNKMCPKCNKPMKIGKAMGGYNWYCHDFPIKCDGIIKEVEFNED